MPSVSSDLTTISYGKYGADGSLPTQFFDVSRVTVENWGKTLDYADDESANASRQILDSLQVSSRSGCSFNSSLAIDQFTGLIGAYLYGSIYNESMYSVDSAEVTAADGYALPVVSAEQSALLRENVMIYVEGTTDPRNSGIKVLNANVDANAAGNNVGVAETTYDESQTDPYYKMYFKGYRIPSGTDVSYAYNANTGIGVLNSTGVGTNAPGLIPGMEVKIGIPGTGGVPSFALTNAVANSPANGVYGRAILLLKQNNSLTFINVDNELQIAAANNGSTDTAVALSYGFAVSPAWQDDTVRFDRRQLFFEMIKPELAALGMPAYQYSIRNRAENLTIAMPPESIIGMNFSCVGRTTTGDMATRMTPNGNAIVVDHPELRSRFATGKNVGRVRMRQDVAGVAATVLSSSVEIANAIGRIPSMEYEDVYQLPVGRISIGNTITLAYEDIKLGDIVGQGAYINFANTLQNDDGAISFNMPSVRFASDTPGFEAGGILTLPGTMRATSDNVFEHALMVTIDVGPTLVPRNQIT